MRAVHLLRKYNPSEWGGTETAVHRLFDGLRLHGVTPVVYCPKLDRPAPTDPLSASGYHVNRFRAFVPVLGISPQCRRQMIAVGGNLLSFDLLPALWREKPLAVVHTHTLGRIGGIALTAARQRRVPLVISIHGGVLDLPSSVKKQFNSPTPHGWEWGKLFGLIFQSHRLLRRADAIVTCNEKEAALLRSEYPDRRIVVQPHGVPLSVYQCDRREYALAAFPQIADKQVLLCLGRIHPVKNQAWLIEQAPAVFQMHPRAMLVLAGACTDEVYGASLQRRIRELGISDQVVMTGGLPPNDPRLVGLLQQACAVVLPSQSETFGLAILEAWAAGSTVLSSRTSGASALIRHGLNGWLFDLDRPQTFHDALSQALHDSSDSKSIRRAGSEQVAHAYDVHVLAGRMKQLYEELIESKNSIRHRS